MLTILFAHPSPSPWAWAFWKNRPWALSSGLDQEDAFSFRHKILSVKNREGSALHEEQALMFNANNILVPAEFEEIDWGDEEDEIELLNYTQKVEREGSTTSKDYDPLLAAESQAIQNAVRERVKRQEQDNQKLQHLVAEHGVDGIITMMDEKKALQEYNETLRTENHAVQG